jgi:hypothetical protein
VKVTPLNVLSHLCRDVRKSVLSHIIITKHTLPHIVARTRDVDDGVRKFAYSILGEKVKIEYLKLNQRRALIKEGLNER